VGPMAVSVPFSIPLFYPIFFVEAFRDAAGNIFSLTYLTCDITSIFKFFFF
jgi:hypothetical protein